MAGFVGSYLSHKPIWASICNLAVEHIATEIPILDNWAHVQRPGRELADIQVFFVPRSGLQALQTLPQLL